MLRNDVSRVTELHGGLIFRFGGDNLRASLALRLSFFCHCSLHVVGQYDVLDLDCRYLGAPRLGVTIDDVLDLQVDARRVREKLVEAELPDDIAHRGLAYLVDRIVGHLEK